MKGDIYIISAPSGTGKSTIIRKLIKIVPALFFSISYTTRTPREREINGKDYFFVSLEEFENLVANNEFLEYCKVHDNYYGTHRDQVLPLIEKGLDVLLDIDVKGAMKIKGMFSDAILIFILPPSLEELLRRLEKRHAESPEALKIRLNTLKEEVLYWKYYDYLLINDYLNKTIEDVKSIIISNRLRKDRQAEIIEDIIHKKILSPLF
jgi:guanylate kinase